MSLSRPVSEEGTDTHRSQLRITAWGSLGEAYQPTLPKKLMRMTIVSIQTHLLT